MKGGELQRGIVDLARTLGWKVAHFRSVPVKYPGQALRWQTPVAADGKGFPDLILVRERIVAVEIKGTGDRVRPEQSDWLSALRMAGVECYVWGSRDWEAEHVHAALARVERKRPPIEAASDPDGYPLLARQLPSL